MKKTRIKLDKIFNFPYVFLDEEENEIEKEREKLITINDILDGKNLHIKKEKKKRLILGRKIVNGQMKVLINVINLIMVKIEEYV